MNAKTNLSEAQVSNVIVGYQGASLRNPIGLSRRYCDYCVRSIWRKHFFAGRQLVSPNAK
jgi:hypothetical protein